MRVIMLWELILVLFLTAFFLHFVWEMWQIPLYVGMSEAGHWSAVVQCTRATVGDGFIALMAYGIAAIATRNKLWLFQRSVSNMSLYLISGLTITVIIEYFATTVYGRWQYSELMPMMPVVNIGISPLLQWIFIPPISIWVSAIILQGRRCDGPDSS